MDEQTDMTKVLVAFHNFANTLENNYIETYLILQRVHIIHNKILWCIEGEGKIIIWLVFEILEVVVNFIQIIYTLYIDLIEILNSQLRYNFS
jgi:hypothetical protein